MKIPSDKKTIAVFFGGRSPEHDVSVVSGLQVLHAIDPSRYDAFPVYVAPDGRWLTGDLLRKRDNFMLDAAALKQLTDVVLDVMPGRRARLLPRKSGFFGAPKPIEFDVALPIFHGLHGEDGCVQGAFDLAGVAYAGMRVMATSLLMDKAATKLALSSLGIPCLPFGVIRRPDEGYLVPKEELAAAAKPIGFPCIVKPVHLGSSIGVAKANNAEEIAACLPAIFEFDDAAIIEPFVKNLVEYNVSVARIDGEVRTSAIERPKTHEELLDFKQKYLAGASGEGDKLSGAQDGEGGLKTGGEPVSEGMLSLTRDLNPDITAEQESNIITWAKTMFEGLGGTGAPRIDFIGNAKSGEIWLNEVNPIPGSYGYFLWEAAKDKPLLFAEFLTSLIEEALMERRKKTLPKDPVPADARLLTRKG